MSEVTESIRSSAHPIRGTAEDYDPLLAAIGESRLVLLGEGSHGTTEFYAERAAITQRLIIEKGFTALAIEADWPDANRVHRYVQSRGEDATAEEALAGFHRFPAWMWRNEVVEEFIEWLRATNLERDSEGGGRVGLYGLDLYNLHGSIEAVLAYLERTDSAAAERARQRYACFDHFSNNPQDYGFAASAGMIQPCEEAALAQLRDLHHQRAASQRHDGERAGEELFFAEQNARLVKNAEQYYRSMFQGRASSWNLRDRHMSETLEALLAHFDGRAAAKIVVWAHNSHLGDARATEMSARGEFNLGQLVRERFGQDAFSVGFTTYQGQVTAASDWGGLTERKEVRPALAESYEALFHEVGGPGFYLNLRETNPATANLRGPRLERAIGVIYLPHTERWSHYFQARLSAQFDAVIHFDETRAVTPLETTSLWEQGELPETYPFAV